MKNKPECKNCDYYEYVLEEYPSSENPILVHSYHRCSKLNKIDVSIENLKKGCNIPIKSKIQTVETKSNLADTQKFEYDIALSYASEQNHYVKPLAIKLRNMGIKVFYDKFEQHKLWGEELNGSLDEIYSEKSKYCVIFISADYFKKSWTTHEMKSALKRASLKEQAKYILPVRFDDTEIPEIQGLCSIYEKEVNTDELAKIIKNLLSS